MKRARERKKKLVQNSHVLQMMKENARRYKKQDLELAQSQATEQCSLKMNSVLFELEMCSRNKAINIEPIKF